MIQLRLNPIFAWDDDRRSYDYDVRLRLRIRPASNIEFRFGPNYEYQVKDAQWVERDGTAGQRTGENALRLRGVNESNTRFHHAYEHQLHADVESSVLCATLHYHRGVYKLQGARGAEVVSVQTVSVDRGTGTSIGGLCEGTLCFAGNFAPGVRCFWFGRNRERRI